MALRKLGAWMCGPEEGESAQSLVWNALAGGLFAGQAAIILLFVSRTDTLETAGFVSLAYALANLFLAFARYGMRNYQVTDVQERFCFADYRLSRVITVVAAALLALVGIGVLVWTGAYGTHKALLVLVIVALKLVDAVEDLYTARYQQVGNFLAGAKLMALRQLLVTVLVCAAVACGIGTIAAFGVGLLASVLLLVLFVSITAGVQEDHPIGTPSGRRTGALLIQCAPLCVGMVLSNYVGNLPKYAIDLYLDATNQAVFGYLMLPVFAVTLLNQFIYQPFVRDLGDLWDARDLVGLRRTVVRQCSIVLGLALLVLVAVLVVGLPMLSLMYNKDLLPYRREFAGLMVGGVVFSLASYLAVPVTAMRAQRVVGVAYAVAALSGLVLQGALVPTFGLAGVILLYALSNSVLLVVFAIVLFVRCGSGAGDSD